MARKHPKSKDTPLARARKCFASQKAMADALDISQQSVSEALKRGKAPPGWCIALERATGGKVTRHELRPDLYPVESSSSLAAE